MLLDLTRTENNPSLTTQGKLALIDLSAFNLQNGDKVLHRIEL